MSAGPFAGKVCIVTGGAAGIGAAICKALAAEGASVAVLDIDADGAAAMAGSLPSARSYSCDVSRSDPVRAAVAAVAAAQGPIDVLVNNAGITGADEYRRMLGRRVMQSQELERDGRITTPLNALAEMTDEDWRRMLSTHLDGTFFCTRAVVPGMQERRSGAIVNMSSVIGIDGGLGIPHYAAAKAGIGAFTRAVAQELAPLGIRVNAVAPGFIDTAMRSALPDSIARGHLRATPMGRLGTVDEIADAVLYLAGPRATYVTGQVLSVNGGLLAR